MNEHDYDTAAKWYDLLFDDRTVDVACWIQFAKKYGGPILELSCGTGRLTIPIAKAGIRIDGMDISLPMLSRFKKKLAHLDRSVTKRISAIHGDITNFSIPGKQYATIFSPWGFIPLTSQQETSALECIKRHLLPDGMLIVDLDNPPERTGDWFIYRLKEYKEFPSLGFSLMREAFNSGSADSPGIMQTIFKISKIARNGTVRNYLFQVRYRAYTRLEFEHALIRQGFEIDHVYGEYDLSPWSLASSRTIVVARLPRHMTVRGMYQRLRMHIE